MKRALAALLIGGGLLVAATPRSLVPTCEFSGYARMRCSDAARLWAWNGVTLGIAGVAVAFASGRFLTALAAAGVLLALVALLVPLASGYCASPRMPCHYGTVPVMRLLAGGLTVLSAGVLAALVRGGREAAA